MREPHAPVRMEPIATLPVFFKLGRRRVLLAGGTEPAVWKAELLSAAGADVTVVAEQPCEALTELASHPPAGSITILRRSWQVEDLSGVALALGALEDDEAAARFRAAAQAAGVPVNVIDKPAFCDFQFGTVVARSPLVIGISTDGAAPVFGQAIRARIEALLPQSLRRWAEAARDWRPAVQAHGWSFRARRRFWEVFADKAFASPADAPADTDFADCEAAAVETASQNGAAVVTLVGAGSGDADGVTLRAIKALQAADIVVHGPSVLPAVVSYARREAVKFRDEGRDSEDVVAMVSAQVSAGRRVAWLDTGSPGLCQRWAARRAKLPAAAIIEQVPGLGRCEACTPQCPGWLVAG